MCIPTPEIALELPFDSRNLRYKTHFGAMPSDGSCLFRILLPRYYQASAAYLCMRRDDWPTPQQAGMFWAGMEGDEHEWWDITFMPDTSGLFFYYFEIDTPAGRRHLLRQKGGQGALSWEGSPWQQTVYDAHFETPGWVKGGVLYQIFPDRFAASGKAKANVPADRILREGFSGMPAYKPDAQGKVRNNDYFGGDLPGIEAKLPYLKSLGVTCLYCNPIFEAHSNHRYDTADYRHIDPLLGTEADFRRLCQKAKGLGIHIILDGVFSHTGADSLYFNKSSRYPTPGAYNSPDSPYWDWYKFNHWPDDYVCWWGIRILPEVREESPDFIAFITGEQGILQHWLQAGASGFRLDVADELPDVFLDALRQRVKAENPEAFVLGEVWEDATTKISYQQRRRYLLGDQLDSVMNYPFANAILHYVRAGVPGDFLESVMALVEHYPKPALDTLMNHIGTHDTPRAITALAGAPIDAHDRDWQAAQTLSEAEYMLGVQRLKLASFLQYTLPGVPSLYYGDEAGMAGYADPFNRLCYPWGQENTDLLAWYRQLGQMRAHASAFRDGGFFPAACAGRALSFWRHQGQEALLCAVNPDPEPLTLPLPGKSCPSLYFGEAQYDGGALALPGYGCAILRYKDAAPNP